MAKVLIVDDSWLTRRSLGNMMKSGGYDVMEAENGEDALDKITSDMPDCILLDLLMPGKTGFDVLQELKDKEILTPVIVVSADIQDTVRKKCMEIGAFGFLNKPPVETELLEKIRDAVGLKHTSV